MSGVIDPSSLNKDGELTPLESSLSYTPYLGKTLRERVERFRKRRVELDEEVAIMRAIACESLAAYELTLNNIDKLSDDKRLILLGAANALVVSALNQVRDMAVAAHRVSQSRDAYDPIEIQQLIFKVVKVIDVELERNTPQLVNAGLDPRIFIQNVTRVIDETLDIGLNNDKTMTTTVIPADEEALLMDSTVPANGDNEAVA